jgi:hypothetical protein
LPYGEWAARQFQFSESHFPSIPASGNTSSQRRSRCPKSQNSAATPSKRSPVTVCWPAAETPPEPSWTEWSPWHKFDCGSGRWRAATASATELPGDANGTKEQI